MATEVTSVLVGPVVVVLMVTVAVAELVRMPVNPLIDAVIWTDPAPTDVTSPEELTVATPGPSELQVTRFVTSSVVEG
jgi:hypothetical protein